jgi:OPA family glycerol-3-phosphate transporter-like MFS transporter
MSVFNWAPTFLQEFKGISLKMAGVQAAVFDIAGMFGGILAGFLSDKIFQGYRGRVGAIFMVLLTICVIALLETPASMTFLHFMVMGCVGFLLSGPQILVGVAAADFASKRAAGTASGLTGVFGYIGTSITGVGIGFLVDNFGWSSAFIFMIISGLLGAVFFALTWNHRSKILG